MTCFLGIDVGTGSARAGLFDNAGHMIAHASHPIRTWHPEPDFAEQSSEDIWQTVCAAVHDVVRESGIAPDRIAGIGFDATCSLVAVDEEGRPVSLSKSGEDGRNIILWADHRAIDEAREIDATGHERLRASGGTISPEMQMPKLKWTRKHLPRSWQRAARFFDLPDWLAFRASGNDTRSLCTTVCKWTYRGEAGLDGAGWDREFLALIGLGELAEEGFARIGKRLLPPGAPLGPLTPKAAADLGLTTATMVATGMIDAHAGALATFGVGIGESDDLTRRLALIAGTSACHVTLAENPACVPGVWGPYYGAVLPGMWANEAGQSMAGAALDTVIARHCASTEATAKAEAEGITIHEYLARMLEDMAAGADLARLAAGRHMLPDFHGNRAPLADPARRAVLWGLGAETDAKDLALDYLACIQSLALGTRHILEVMGEKGIAVDTIVVSGGLAKNPAYLKAHADATGCNVLIPDQPEPVLAGSAMLAAVGAGAFADLPEAMAAMSGGATLREPDPEAAALLERKYRVFRRMQDDFARYRQIMETGEEPSNA